MSAITLTLKFNVDPPNIGQALDSINSSLRTVGVSAENVTEKSAKINTLDDGFVRLGLRLQGFMNLFSVVSSSFGSFIATSNEGERAVAKLTQALDNQGIKSDELVTDLRSFAAARQELTGIDDDATVAILGQLTAMGLRGQALKDATVATQDLASLMDGDMNGAVRVIADAFNGSTGMLRRYIKGLDDTDIKQRGTISIVEQMQKAFGGQAEAMGTTGAGAIAKYEANLDDLKQSMGDLIKDSLGPIIGLLSGAIKFLNEAGPAGHTAALGVTALGVAFAFLNTSMGGLPYIIGGIIVGLIALGQWIGGLGDKEADAATITRSLTREFSDLGKRINDLKGAAGDTDKLKKLREELELLRNPVTEASLTRDIAAIRREVSGYEADLAKLKKQSAEMEILTPEQKSQLREMLKAAASPEEKAAIVASTREWRFANADRIASRRELLAQAEAIDGKLSASNTKLAEKETERDIARTQRRKKEADDRKQHEVTMRELASETVVASIVSESDAAAKRREILMRRIADLEAVKKPTLDQEEELAKAKLDLVKEETDEERRLRQSLSEISARIRDLEIEGMRNEHQRAVATIDERYRREIEAAKGNADLIAQLNRAKNLELEAENRRHHEEVRKNYAQDHQVAVAVFSGISSGAGTMWSEIVVGHRQAKNTSDAIWLSMRNTALGAIGRILERQIESYLIDTAAHSAAETTKTATTEANALVRVATTIWEVSTKIVTWTAEQVAFIAKELVMTAVAVVQGGIRLALVIAEAAASIVKAVAQAIAGLGPFGLILAPGIIAAGVAVFAGMKKAFGFAKGGEFGPGERGFLEGGQYEIVAPRRTFDQIMQDEIVPMLVRTTQIVSLRSPVESGAAAWKELKKEFAQLRKEIKRNVPQVNIMAETDLNKYDKAEKKLQRSRLALAL